MNEVTLLTHLNDMFLNDDILLKKAKYILLHRTCMITHARHWRPWKQNVDQSYKSCGPHLFLVRTLNFDKLTYCGFIVGKLQSGKPDRLENFYSTNHFGLYLFTWKTSSQTILFWIKSDQLKTSSLTNHLWV